MIFDIERIRTISNKYFTIMEHLGIFTNFEKRIVLDHLERLEIERGWDIPEKAIITIVNQVQ